MIPLLETVEFYESLLMREDIELSHALLTMIADEDDWPSRYRKADYMAAFPDKSKAEIAFHLRCLIKAELVEGEVALSDSINAPTTDFEAFIKGLTPTGNNYIAHLESKTSIALSNAADMVREKGLEITVSNVSIALQSVIHKLLGS